MHATLLTDVGLLVDGRVLRRMEDDKACKSKGFRVLSQRATLADATSSPLDGLPHGSAMALDEDLSGLLSFEELQALPYECEAMPTKIPQQRFEFMDILPWGFRSPTTVFSTVGLHTDRGLVVGVGPAGLIRIRPYSLCRSRLDRAKYGNEPFTLCQTSSSGPRGHGQPDHFPVLPPLHRQRPPRRPVNEKGHLNEAAIRFFAERESTAEAIEKRRAFFRVAAFLRDRDARSRQGIEISSPTAALGELPAPFTPPSLTSPFSPAATLTSPFPPAMGAGPAEGGGPPEVSSPTYGADSTNPLSLLFVAEEDATEECRASQERLLDQWTSDLELWDIADLQLAPALALHPPISPCKVGSRVMARRFGGGIEIATVVAAQFDVSYSLRYDSDGGVDVGVLHNDIHLLEETAAEPCTVRDRVVVTFQMQVPAMVIEAMGREQYRVVLLGGATASGSGQAAMPIQLQNIALITPLLKDGLYSDPQHVQWFKELDPSCTGAVTWRLVRELIREMVEPCGLPLAEEKVRRIQSTISSRGQAAVRHQFFHMEDNMPLTFAEFEYALLAAQNMTAGDIETDNPIYIYRRNDQKLDLLLVPLCTPLLEDTGAMGFTFAPRLTYDLITPPSAILWSPLRARRGAGPKLLKGNRVLAGRPGQTVLSRRRLRSPVVVSYIVYAPQYSQLFSFHNRIMGLLVCLLVAFHSRSWMQARRVSENGDDLPPRRRGAFSTSTRAVASQQQQQQQRGQTAIVLDVDETSTTSSSSSDSCCCSPLLLQHRPTRADKGGAERAAAAGRPPRSGDSVLGQCCVPHYIAQLCRSAELLSQNAQLIVMSGGLDASAVTSALLASAWAAEQGPEKPLEERGGVSSSTAYANVAGWSLRSAGTDPRTSTPARSALLVVVVPDGVPSAALEATAAALERSLDREMSQHPTRGASRDLLGAVRPILEGASTKERCALYEQGGVVLASGRVLCADVLHRRLSPALIRLCIFLLTRTVVHRPPSIGSTGGRSRWRGSAAGGPSLGSGAMRSLPFFMDLLRDGRSNRTVALDSRAGAGTCCSGTPTALLVSDEPVLMQRLVQGHQRGRPRFTQQLSVGDIQLFPRFRLEFMQHYESCSKSAAGRKETALRVDRVSVQPPAAVVALHGLLGKILAEIWSELQKLHQRLAAPQPQQQRSAPPPQHGFFASPRAPWEQRRQAAQRLDEATGARFLPRGTAADIGQSQSQMGRGEAGPTYVRKPWRDPADPYGIRFDWLSQEAAVDASQTDLDEDLRAALKAKEGTCSTEPSGAAAPGAGEWEFKALVESLLDVRRLRRDVQHQTPYAFLWSLEHALRLRRLHRGPASATAIWTLSALFPDVMTVATQRIGSVVSSKADAPNPAPALTFVPSEEHDPVLEVLASMIASWSRGALRRKRQRSLANGRTTEERDDGAAARLLVLCTGRGMVVRCVQRCCYGAEGYRQLLLNQFLHLYQVYHRGGGAEAVVAAAKAAQQAAVPPTPPPPASQRSARLAAKTAEPPSSGDAEPPVDGAPEEVLREQLWRFNCIAADCALAHDDEEEDGEEDGDTSPDPPLKATQRRSQSRKHTADGASLSSAAEAMGGMEDDAVDGFLFSQSQASGAGISLHQMLMTQPLAPLPAAHTSTGREEEAKDMEAEVEQQQVEAALRENPSVPNTPPATPLVFDFRTSGDLFARGSSPLIVFVEGDQLDESVLRQWLDGTHSALAGAAALPVRTKDVLLTAPNLALLRMLESQLQDPHAHQRPAGRGRQDSSGVRVRLVTTPLADELFQADVAAEREAFETLAHAKATLTSTLLVDRDSLRATAEALEAGMTISRRSNRPTAFHGRVGAKWFTGANARDLTRFPENPRVIFDDREFRCGLPHALYAAGMDLVPLTLITADYVLSKAYAVERKSVRDYLQSLQSGRLAKQLGAMTRQYEYPICLIEFTPGEPLRLVRPTTGSSSSAAAHHVFFRSGKLVARYPRTRFLWSRSPLHSAALFLRLKQSVAADNMDPSEPALTMSAVALQEQNEPTLGKEAAHAAARVLSCFPGIHPRNASAVMQLCGSLAGLATISKESLERVMGPKDATVLYSFLHDPLVEEID
eukprot:gene11398-7903_t